MNNPFNNNTEDTSFEQGMPVSQAAKNAAKAVSAQASAQIQAANKAIVDQLYGSSTSAGQDQGTDETNPQNADHTNASRAAAAQFGANKSSNPNQTPEEQVEMEKIRRELFANYSSKFKSAQNGAHGLITDIEQEMEKARQERNQKELQRKQEEEEEERRREEEKKAQEQENIAMPAGKKTGVMFGKKQQQPFAVQMERTKAEANRGTTG